MDSKELDQRKTLQSLTVVKNADENDEFEKQRIAAIAEVAKAKEVCNALFWVCIFIIEHLTHLNPKKKSTISILTTF